ncbi:DUF4160 domain-containing protein [Ancylobacter sp.]|uniref:DUF4160 domain-containing protein n=1 Tax=Ancylobacter sp. TaxID=1872567 RepID=UPI003D0F0E28
MPVVALVDGVKIKFYANDHPPPHFHAEFAEHRAVIHIRTLRVAQGSLPEAKRRAVIEWAASRQAELINAYTSAIAKLPLRPME